MASQQHATERSDNSPTCKCLLPEHSHLYFICCLHSRFSTVSVHLLLFVCLSFILGKTQSMEKSSTILTFISIQVIHHKQILRTQGYQSLKKKSQILQAFSLKYVCLFLLIDINNFQIQMFLFQDTSFNQQDLEYCAKLKNQHYRSSARQRAQVSF